MAVHDSQRLCVAAHAPRSVDLVQQLPEIGAGLEASLRKLAQAPSIGATSQCLAQLAGAQTFIAKVREALQREANQ
jgi:hypothetical protein